MSDVQYGDETVARDYEAFRYRFPEVLGLWCDRIRPWIEVGPGRRRLLDVGSGTGIWSLAFAERFLLPVVGVEPAAGMRAVAAAERRHPLVDYVAGLAGALPLRDGSVTAAWLSTVVHQFPDLPAALADLRRVLVPDAPVIVRTFLPERHTDTDLYVHFPGARRLPVLGLALAPLVAAFEDAGFRHASIDTVYEPREESYDDVLARLPKARATDSSLAGLSDEEWEAGLASIRRCRDQGEHPVPFGLDEIVFT
jgi:ubiquinone/menaquinone biosynthesis C-methylase UbiE